jgi:hypothetical protein
VWTLAALFVAVLFFAMAIAFEYRQNWSGLERFYLPVYAKTWLRGLLSKAQAQYRVIDVVDRKRHQRLALDDEVESSTNAAGEMEYSLTEEAQRRGMVRLAWHDEVFIDRGLHEYLGHWIYRDQTVWDYVKAPAYAALSVFILLLLFTLPRDRQ